MRQQIAELKKSIILEIADKVFKLQGYESTAVSQIAKEAGVSIGTIYGFFDSKEGLFQAVHNSNIQKAYEYLHTFFNDNSNTPAENLKIVLHYYFSEVSQCKKSVQETLLTMPFKIGCSGSTENPMLDIYALVADELKKLHATQTLRNEDFLQHSFNFRNLAAAYVERWALLEDIVLEDKLDECLDIFLKGALL